MPPDEHFNNLAVTRYRSEFGRNSVFELRVSPDKDALPQHEVAAHHKGRTLFGGNVTCAKLASLLSQGAEIKATRLSENFDFDHYLESHRHNGIPLLAASPKGRVELFVGDSELKPEDGWTVISLIPADAAKPAAAADQAPSASGPNGKTEGRAATSAGV